MRIRFLFSLSALALVALSQPVMAQDSDPASPPVPVSAKAVNTLRGVMASRQFATARSRLAADYDRIVQDVITLTEIPAPPFKETARGEAFKAMLREHGLSDIETDAEGNVMGLRRGTGGGGLLVIAAHLDTVFPEGTDVKVRREGEWLHAPGIGDDTCSLSFLLAMIRAMDAAGIRTKSDILFVGNVGEEGLGDLRGTRFLFSKGKYAGKITQFISFEPGRGRVTNAGVGSKRYKLTFKGPGGHSFGDFGMVNPAYALGDAIAQFSQTRVPADPKTTFNVGVLSGGTSVNSIPFEVSALIDMRSAGRAELKALEDAFLAIPPRAAARENAARSTARGEVIYTLTPIGDRPVGATPDNAAVVQMAAAAMLADKGVPEFGSSSTDSNVPMSLGIPAVTLGSGFDSRRAHSLEESLRLDRDETIRHMARGMATVLALAGAQLR